MYPNYESVAQKEAVDVMLLLLMPLMLFNKQIADGASNVDVSTAIDDDQLDLAQTITTRATELLGKVFGFNAAGDWGRDSPSWVRVCTSGWGEYDYADIVQMCQDETGLDAQEAQVLINFYRISAGLQPGNQYLRLT